MSSTAPPEQVGSYRLLQDVETRDMSVRVIEMAADADSVAPHVHLRSAQLYLVLEGAVIAQIGGVEQQLGPHEAAPVPIGALHSVRPVGGRAVVANVSVPPLRADDQSPAFPEVVRSDLLLPTIGSDFDD